MEILADIRYGNFNTDDTADTSTQVVGTRSEPDDVLTQELTTQVKDNFVI